MSMEKLYESLHRRLRPEDVAELILKVLHPNLTRSERDELNKIAKHSLKRGMYSFTSMAQDFHCAIAPDRQVKKAKELFETAYKIDCTDPEAVLALIRTISKEIEKTVGKGDFKDDRMNREARKSHGLDISRRRYNKLFRFLGRFEQKVEKYVFEMRKERATRVSKSGLAFKVSEKDFMKSKEAACFVAYFTARKNRRSVFTNSSQDRAYDNLSKLLLNKFKSNPCRAGWRIIARVMPDAEIVAKLTKKDKMELFATWIDVLNDIADMLKTVWLGSRFNRETMVVSRGDDSSTWNSLAGAWNTARQGWFSLVYALGMDKMLETVCFGKVMRLMAADVVRWHQSSGGQLEPDTLVWATLPAPWEVFSGEKECSKQIVEGVCKKNNVDPVRKNWIMPIKSRSAVEFKPTPELVHGVTVSHPGLANILKKAGWFSGKQAVPVSEAVVVDHDEHGAVVGANFANASSI